MIDEIQFSAPGRAPTPFEVRLLHQVRPDSPWGPLALRLIRDYGPQQAAVLMCTVLDELGAGKIAVPKRAQFFRRLWSSERDALIVQLAGRPDWTRADIAAALGVSQVWVGEVLKQTSGADSLPRAVVDTGR